jgi:hypothetical protein
MASEADDAVELALTVLVSVTEKFMKHFISISSADY